MSKKLQLLAIDAHCKNTCNGFRKLVAEIDKDGRLVMRLDSMSIDTQSKKVYNHHQPYGDLKDLDINENQVSLTIKFPPTDLHPEGIEQQMSFFTDDIEWLNDLNNEYAKAE